MTDPLALLPLAAAAGGGHVDGFEAQQLVAAGLTLLQRSAPLVRALSGRRAAILLPTSPAYLAALAACEGRGAVLINPLAAAPEVAFQLADANVGAVFTIEALAAKLPATVPRILLDDVPRTARVVAGDRTQTVDLGSHFGFELSGEADAAGRDEEAVVVYTSAMAGTPLGAVLTHRNLLANARGTVETGAITGDDHALAVLPFAHLFGLVASGLGPLLAGARLTTCPRFQPPEVAERLAADGITILVGVPAVFKALLRLADEHPDALRSPTLRLCICGGAELPAAVQDRWFDATGVELRQGYGLTEAGPVCLFNRVDQPNRRGRMGVPFPRTEVTIRDPETGSPRPAGVEGEICVRGESVFRGYVRGGELGLQRRDGWLHTGDLGVAGDDGSVSFRGVAKAMFTRNGFDIYPRELERAVAELSGVRRARVWPVPDAARENEIALEVAGNVDEAEVRAWCAARLSAYKQPGLVRVASA